MKEVWRRFSPRLWLPAGEIGATAVEYGLIIALIAVTVIGAVSALGTSVFDVFDEAATMIGRCDRDRGNSADTPAFDNVGGPACNQ